MKEFNVTGACMPELHYMVDITKRLEDIREYVESFPLYLPPIFCVR